MTIPRRKKPGPKRKPKLRSKDIGGAKYLRSVMDLLRPLHAHKDCPNRTLHFDEYVAYLLLYFFNPIVTSLRGLQQVSTLAKVRRKLKLPRFSLGSFSEARNVFDPSLLEPLIGALVEEVADAGLDPRLSALDVAATGRTPGAPSDWFEVPLPSQVPFFGRQALLEDLERFLIQPGLRHIKDPAICQCTGNRCVTRVINIPCIFNCVIFRLNRCSANSLSP